MDNEILSNVRVERYNDNIWTLHVWDGVNTHKTGASFKHKWQAELGAKFYVFKAQNSRRLETESRYFIGTTKPGYYVPNQVSGVSVVAEGEHWGVQLGHTVVELANSFMEAVERAVEHVEAPKPGGLDKSKKRGIATSTSEVFYAK